MSNLQCGGKKNRSTADQLFVLRAILDYNKYLNNEIYLIFGDIEKCFDKLWLKDCINELHAMNMNSSEVLNLYEMNREVRVVINTPLDITDEVTIG